MTVTGFVRPPAAEDLQDAQERREAVRALLRWPLITAGGAHEDELRLVRRHRVALTRFFAESLGYRLTVEPAGARLFKTGLGRDATRPLPRRSGAPFTPRGYALLTLTIAALTRVKAQLLVDELVAAVRSAAVEAEIDVDLDAIADRRALHAALMVLVRLGVLRERDGDLEHWVEERKHSLLDVNRDVLGLLVAAPLSTHGSMDDLLAPARVPSAAGGARIATRRRLAECPVLSVEELPEDHAEWWRRNRNREREWFHDQLGLDLELRAEGALALDPDEELTDLSFPGRGRTSHLALLVLEALTDQFRQGGASASPRGEGAPAAWHRVSAVRLAEVTRSVVTQWASGLRRDQREDPGLAVAESMRLLESVGLVRRAGDDLLVHAAASRYRPVATLAERSTTGEQSLFDPDEPS
ncbi:MAG: TIGR02678 family protein [Micrococcales bacterium]|nr:TIGR02678 family protein [Micrococcales bacterium]